LTGASSSNGVDIVGNRLNVVVRNGAIRNWWICLQAAASSSCRFEGLLLSGGANLDLQAGDDSLVESCRANGSSVGIRVNNGCTIRNCQVSTNGTGILAIAGSTIVDCTAIANQRGIEADEGSTIKGCTVTAGGGNFGIITSSGCTVTGCTVEGNQSDGISLDRGTVKDCTVRNVIGNGIDLFLYCHAIGNTCIENTGAGIRCTQSGDSVVGNMVTANGRGIWCNPATGNLIIQNRANGNSTNYDIGPSNTAGPIVNSANIATSTNPHANYSY
jgi:parallel beta-helix repeat protein